MSVIIGHEEWVTRIREGISKARFEKLKEGKFSPSGKKVIALFLKGIYQEIM